MKRITKSTIALLLIALAGNARATLIDLTPGGFSPLNPPQVYIDWVNNNFGHNAFGIAYETPSGWVPGFLGPPLFTSTSLGGSTAALSWNLTGTPYSMGWVFVGGPDGIVNMYQVSLDQMLSGEGLITINGIYNITGIGIYGPVRISTPDGGTTLVLFGLAVACIFCVRFWRRTRLEGVFPPRAVFSLAAGQEARKNE
jgi:hypothetical protein